MTKDLKFLWKVLYLLSLSASILCIRVTLEGGQTGTANKAINLGETSTLVCTLSGAGNVQWVYRSSQSASSVTEIVQNSEVNSGHQERFELRGNNLFFKKIERDDTGFYRCTARSSSPTDTEIGEGSYNVTVLIPPSEPVCGFPGNLRLTLGKEAQITCRSSDGVPTPGYTWFKNGALLPVNSQDSPEYRNTSFLYSMESGTLIFTIVVNEPSYQCGDGLLPSGVNPLTSPRTSPHCSPPPFTIDYNAPIGGQQILITFHIAVLQKVTEGDAGSYYCQASNTAGSKQCRAASLTTAEEDVGAIIGIVFGCVFGVLLIAILVWWTWKRGYCDGFGDKGDHDDMDIDDANDVILDGTGPIVTKPPSVFNGSTGKQEASMMI